MFKFSLRAPRIFESKLYDEVQFYSAFTADIKQVTSTLTIESPFICYRRAAYLLPDFVRAIDRGVAITIYTRHPNEHDGSMRQQAWSVIDSFENMGVQVQFIPKLHRKLAIIDESILWEGSLNILSQANSREVMHRIVSRAECKAMKKFLSVKG